MSTDRKRNMERPVERGGGPLEHRESDDISLLLLGQRIRNHRLQQKQDSSGRPWSQEDLAVAIGSDKAHINRLECGRQSPTYDTLNRICDALDLSWPARRRLLGLAGFLATLPVPSEEETAQIGKRLGRVLHSVSYPAYLVDQEQRICDVNEAFATIFLAYPDRETCLLEVRQNFLLELLCSSHPASFRLRKALGDFDSLALRHLVLLRRGLQRQPSSVPHQVLLNEVLADRHLCALWLRMCANLQQDMAPQFLDHQVLHIRQSVIGPYSIDLWHSVLQADERFSVVHLVPSDDRSRAQFNVRASNIELGRSPRRGSRATRMPRGPSAFPSKSLTLAIPWATGGVTDIGARILAPFVERELGQKIDIFNQDEAQSPIALRELAMQPADGYHLAFINQPALDAAYPSARAAAQAEQAFSLIATQAFDPVGVFVRPESRYASLRDLVKDALRRPGEITVGTSGIFTPAHLGAMMLERAAGIRFSYVHYRGSMEHIARFLAGQTDIAFFGSGITLPAVQSDELRALGMFTNERFELMPDTPTLTEIGFRGLHLASIRGIFVPTAVPDRIQQHLRAAFTAAVRDEEHIAAMNAAGLGVRVMMADQLKIYSREQAELYQTLCQKSPN